LSTEKIKTNSKHIGQRHSVVARALKLTYQRVQLTTTLGLGPICWGSTSLSITTLIITALSRTGLFTTPSITTLCHHASFIYCYAECLMPSIAMLNVIMMIVVAPQQIGLRHSVVSRASELSFLGLQTLQNSANHGSALGPVL
jgi:hypothetical protein